MVGDQTASKNESGDGPIDKWAYQQMILAHVAISPILSPKVPKAGSYEGAYAIVVATMD